MSESHDNHDKLEMIDAALRREIMPCRPLDPELTERIVASIRTSSLRHKRAIALRRFAFGAAAIAACVAMAIGFLFSGNPAIDRPEHPKPPSDSGIISRIPPATVIMDDSLAAMEEFAADSMAKEMRDLAQDASDIGSVILASLPGDVVDSKLWAGLRGD